MPGSTPRTCRHKEQSPSKSSFGAWMPYIPLGQIFQPTAFRSDIKDLVKSMFPLFWGVYRGSNVLIRAGWEIRQSLRGAIGRSIAPMRPALIDRRPTPASASRIIAARSATAQRSRTVRVRCRVSAAVVRSLRLPTAAIDRPNGPSAHISRRPRDYCPGMDWVICPFFGYKVTCC